METKNLELLKKILSIPSYSHREDLVIEFLCNYCQENNLDYQIDDVGNVFITKGEIAEGEYYPLVGAHMDTVHFPEPKEIRESNGFLSAHNPITGRQIGIGGDDLAGIALSLMVMENFSVCKASFYIAEEIGCIGSKHAAKSNREFYENVGYFIEFDAPEDYMISHICSGVELFDVNGEMFTKTSGILKEAMGEKMRLFNHPYTDVAPIKRAFDFTCINVAAGYFGWHSSREIVSIDFVEKARIMGIKMIEQLGLKKYEYVSKFSFWG